MTTRPPINITSHNIITSHKSLNFSLKSRSIDDSEPTKRIQKVILHPPWHPQRHLFPTRSYPMRPMPPLATMEVFCGGNSHPAVAQMLPRKKACAVVTRPSTAMSPVLRSSLAKSHSPKIAWGLQHSQNASYVSCWSWSSRWL